MKRRDFLHVTGFFVISASTIGAGGCGDDDQPPGGDDAGPDGGGGPVFAFPQGVASGDPRPSSVVLWTRATRIVADGEAIEVTVEVATDDAFTDVVAQETVSATAASDHTLRVLVTDLDPATTYFYRFTAGTDTIGGRTRTAPAIDADVEVHFAWVSCQDFVAGNHSAYRQLIADDEARPAAEQIQFIVHLGDFIYETIDDGFQAALDDNFEPIDIVNADGTPRVLAPFPSGANAHAETLADYRHLYKQFLTDPDLRAARARWPFIQTWDDHEFTNDAWQSQANYDNDDSTDEPAQVRKVASNQAWFEYVPAQLSGITGLPVESEASDFEPADVSDAAFTAPNADNFVDEENNAAAVASLTIYRSFRFGQHMDLVITDQRSYRSDHAIPEEISDGNPVFFDPRNAVPIEMVNVMDAGATANGGNPPAEVLGEDNPRIASPPGTMLGAAQKAWWKETMSASDATWKFWGNEVSLMRMLVKSDPNDFGVPSLIVPRVLNADAWDGYPTERRELLSYLASEEITNVVSIAGDIHAHFAGVLLDDYDGADPTPVGVELVAAGISSNSLFSFFEDATRGLGIPALREIITYDGTPDRGAFVENMNLLVMRGALAAATMADTNDLTMALADSDPAINTHMRYADTNSQGYGTCVVRAGEIEAQLVTIERPIERPDGTPPGIKRVASFTVPAVKAVGATTMDTPTFTGDPPFPFPLPTG
jgi:alkaline phosphatase D